jgi:hypothetical protein
LAAGMGSGLTNISIRHERALSKTSPEQDTKMFRKPCCARGLPADPERRAIGHLRIADTSSLLRKPGRTTGTARRCTYETAASSGQPGCASRPTAIPVAKSHCGQLHRCPAASLDSQARRDVPWARLAGYAPALTIGTEHPPTSDQRPNVNCATAGRRRPERTSCGPLS